MIIKTFKCINSRVFKLLKNNVFSLIIIFCVAYFSLALIFASIYFRLPPGYIEYAYTKEEKAYVVTFWDCLHYSLTTQSTVGYGDFYPQRTARWIASFQAFLGIFLNSAVIGIIVFKLIKRQANIRFTEYCCYDPDKNTFVFRFFNADADDLVQVSVTLSLGRKLLKQEDPFIFRKGYGIALDFFEDAFTPAGLLTAVRSISDEEGRKANNEQLKPVNNIISPLGLRERDDALILSVAGTYHTSGSVVYARREYPFDKIKCGIYQQVNENLGKFEKIRATDDQRCTKCCFHHECRLDVASNIKKMEKSLDRLCTLATAIVNALHKT